MIQAVILDMDGTMYDTERLSLAGWVDAAEKFGCTISREDFLSFRGRPVEVNSRAFEKFRGRNGADYFEMRAIRTEYMQRYFRAHGIPVKDGLYDLLDFLKKAGIRTGVATGTARETAEDYWDRTDVRKYLDFSICGKEAGEGKPAPDIFLNAARCAGERPENCAVLEDSPNGIRSGAAAGCVTFMIPDLDEPDAEIRSLCTYVCRNLREVIPVIRKSREEG